VGASQFLEIQNYFLAFFHAAFAAFISAFKPVFSSFLLPNTHITIKGTDTMPKIHVAAAA
jgi:hypothetical protein